MNRLVDLKRFVHSRKVATEAASSTL